MFGHSPHLHAQVLRNLGKVTRLEFCLKGPVVNDVFSKVLNDPLPVAPGLPPLPPAKHDEMSLRCVNARVLRAMFRQLLEGFPHGTRRKIKRLTVPELIAAGIKQNWKMPDGTPLADLYLQAAGRTKYASARRLVHELDFGVAPFS